MQLPTPTNVAPNAPKKPGGKKFLTVLSWVLGIILLLGGLGALASKEIVPGIFTIIAGLVFIPPLTSSLKFIVWIRSASVVLWFIVIGVSTSGKSEKPGVVVKQTVPPTQTSETTAQTAMAQEPVKESAVLPSSPVQDETPEPVKQSVSLETKFITAAENYYNTCKRYREMCYDIQNNTPMAQRPPKFQKSIDYYQNKLIPALKAMGDAQVAYQQKYEYDQFADLFVKYKWLKVVYNSRRTAPDRPDICKMR